MGQLHGDEAGEHHRSHDGPLLTEGVVADDERSQSGEPEHGAEPEQ